MDTTKQTFTIWEFKSVSSPEVVIAARVSEPTEPQHEYQKVLAKIDAFNKTEALEMYKKSQASKL